MVNHAATIDLTNRAEVARVLPQAPLVASYHTGWSGLIFTHYHHPPHETVEHCLRQHSLVVTDPKSGFRAERHLDGRLRRCGDGGPVDVIPAFLNHWTSWNQDAEFSVIAVCPTLLSRATGAQGEVELVPQVSVEDLVIEQLALALRAKIQTGCLSGRLYGEPLGIAIAARLAGNYGVSRPKIKASGLSRSQLARVVDYMQANLARDLSVLDLAALTGMSESHFSRCFKRSVGGVALSIFGAAAGGAGEGAVGGAIGFD